MMGFEPIPRFSRERILSPLRLPFRHIGAFAAHFKLVMQSAKRISHSLIYIWKSAHSLN
jgi:hypothetical protein